MGFRKKLGREVTNSDIAVKGLGFRLSRGWRLFWAGLTKQRQNVSQVSMLQAMEFLHTLRVQVPDNHILTQNLHYNHYYQNPKYLSIGYMDP